MTNFSFKIYDDLWNAYLVDDDDNVIAGEDAAAETDFEKQEIYFRNSDLNKIIVLHELFHAFVGYTYTENANLSQTQMEEVCCTLFSNKWKSIVELSAVVYDEMIKIRDGTNDL